MCLLTFIRTVLASSLLFVLFVQPSTMDKIFLNETNLNDTECSCFPKMVNVPWSAIKTQINNLENKDEAFNKELLSRIRVQKVFLPIKWCIRESTSNQELFTECDVGPMVRRTQVVPIRDGSKSRLVSFDYIEPLDCLCSGESQSVTGIFPVIVHAQIAEFCLARTEVKDSVHVDVGTDALMEFIYETSETTDAPKTFMIHKDDGFSYPLTHQLLRTLPDSYVTPSLDDWRSKTNIYAANGRVRLQIQNTNKTDEGTYFCWVEFLNSSACFSSVRLKVSNDTEDPPYHYCEPRLTFADWTTVQQEMKKSPKGHRPILKSNINTTFWFQKCTPGPISHRSNGGNNGRCVSNSTLTRQMTRCVPNLKNNREAKILIDYEEDLSCFWDTEGTAKRHTEMEIRTINITKIERNGTCANTCKPENVTVSWKELRVYLTKWTFIRISETEKSKDLTFQKCRQELSPCSRPGTFCDVKKEKKTRRNMKLQNSGLTLTIKFYEAEACHCRERSKMSYNEETDLLAPPQPPVVTYAVIRDI